MDLISISLCFTSAHCSGLNCSLCKFLKLEQWLSEVIGCDLQKEIDFIFNVKCTCVYTMKQKCHKTIPLLPEMHSHSTDIVGTYFLLGIVLGACVSLFPDKNPCHCGLHSVCGGRGGGRRGGREGCWTFKNHEYESARVQNEPPQVVPQL